MTNRRYAAAVIGILLLGTALRFLGLGQWSMWVDEAMTWSRATTGVLSDQGPMYSTAPLNFLVTRWIISSADSSLFWLRFFPAVCGCLGVGAVMFAADRIGGRLCAVSAGLLVALSAWHIEWSQTARHYSPVFLVSTLAVTGYYLFWETGRTRWLLLALAGSVLGLASHSSALFQIASMGVYTVVVLAVPARRKEIATRRKAMASAISFGVLAALYVPIVYLVASYLSEHKTPWNPPIDIGLSIGYYLGIFPVLLGGLVGLAGALSGRRECILGLCWLLTPIALVMIAASFTIASGAYALPSVAALAVLLGLAISRVAQEGARRGWIAAVILLVALSGDYGSRAFLYFTTQQGNRPPWREAIAWVDERASPEDKIFSTDAKVVRYYLGDLSRGIWVDRWTPPSGSERQWMLVLGGKSKIDSPALAVFLREGCLLRKVFYRNTGPKRRDVEIYECQRGVRLLAHPPE